MPTPDSCEKILVAGANLKIEGLALESCVRLATVAKAAGVHLEIKASFTTESFIRIAAAGGKNVTIDLTK
jgi:hypothetical protein